MAQAFCTKHLFDRLSARLAGLVTISEISKAIAAHPEFGEDGQTDVLVKTLPARLDYLDNGKRIHGDRIFVVVDRPVGQPAKVVTVMVRETSLGHRGFRRYSEIQQTHTRH